MKLENAVVKRSRVQKAKVIVMTTMNVKETSFVGAIIVAQNFFGTLLIAAN